MDVTSKNFLQLLPDIRDTIKQCNFIAFDTELSGLMRDRNWNVFDLPKDRFAKSVEHSRGYFIMQFGLACFTKTDSNNYSSKTYNFYIFPQSNGCATHSDIDRTFSLQAHAIQFLSGHNFDFNKLFKDGLSYVTFIEQKKIKSAQKSERKANQELDPVSGLPKFVPQDYKPILKAELELVKKKYKEFKASKKAIVNLSSGDQDDVNMENNNDSDSNGFESANETDVKDEFTITLTRCTNKHKKTIMKKLLESQPFSNSIEVDFENQNKSDSNLIVRFVDEEAKERKQKDAEILAKGFLEVLESIITNRKPLVGHNLSLDLIQIINQFFEPLTTDYQSFKETCQSLFPFIYDTKYIAHSILDQEQLSNNASRLEDLYSYTCNSYLFPKIHIEQIDLNSTDENNQSPHQAGYDAFMCGYSFIKLCEMFLEEKKKLKIKKEDPDSNTGYITQNQFLMDEFANKIHMSYSHDFKSFNLDCEEHEPDRSHVFYIEHPSTWKLEDLFALFSPYGGIHTGRLTPTSSLCALRNQKFKEKVMKLTKDNLGQSNYKIYTYNYYYTKGPQG